MAQGGDRCVWLRARDAYGRGIESASWATGDSAVDGYWCLRTMEPAGPDDHLVHAHRCHASRACFEATPAERIPLDLPVSPPEEGEG